MIAYQKCGPGPPASMVIAGVVEHSPAWSIFRALSDSLGGVCACKRRSLLALRSDSR
jgi:hypothetical protein